MGNSVRKNVRIFLRHYDLLIPGLCLCFAFSRSGPDAVMMLRLVCDSLHDRVLKPVVHVGLFEDAGRWNLLGEK